MSRLAVAAICCFGAPSVAHAGGTAGANPSNADEASSTCRDEAAFAAYDRAQSYYREGRFQEAVDELEAAFSRCPDAAIAHNLARAYEGMADFDGAAAAYERYLAQAPAASDRPAVERRIANLRAKAAAEPTTVVVVKEQPVGFADVAPWTVFGVGLLGVGAGAVVGSVALEAHDEAKTAASHRDAVAADLRGGELAGASTGLFVGGGVLVAAGLTWAIVEATSDGDGVEGAGAATWQWSIGPTAMQLSTRF